jgi:hypothetical protein
MREITDHIVEGDSANHQLKIEVVDEHGQGGANHLYEISGFKTGSDASWSHRSRGLCSILFQNGPPKEFGVNGVTNEALLAVVIDRLRSFQNGPFACKDNEDAYAHCMSALWCLQTRTRTRIARGVEGTHEK